MDAGSTIHSIDDIITLYPERVSVPTTHIATNDEKSILAKMAGAPAAHTVLRQDGPTMAEWVAAGYNPAAYPPHGYAVRSTPANGSTAPKSVKKTGPDGKKYKYAYQRVAAERAAQK